MRLLVIDDAPAVAASAAHALHHAGHVVRVATSVDAAHGELDGDVDVVVLDHHLDRPSELLRHRLAHLRHPVLVVSGLDDDAARAVASAHGWTFLAKPFDDDALCAAVAAILPSETPVPDATGPRPTIAPEPAPAAVAPTQLPPPPPAAQVTPSGRPVPPVAVQVLDRIGDIVGVIVIALLCSGGKIGGELALIGIGGILGVGTGLRQIGTRSPSGAGVGVTGLLLLGASRWLTPAAAGAELARASGLLGLLALVAGLALGCP